MASNELRMDGDSRVPSEARTELDQQVGSSDTWERVDDTPPGTRVFRDCRGRLVILD